MGKPAGRPAPTINVSLKIPGSHIKRDMAGLINIPVSISDTTEQFVFDTGANISVITESNAKRKAALYREKNILK